MKLGSYFKIVVKKDFSDVVDVVKDEVTKGGFSVLHVHDVQETFKKKEIEHGPYNIIEFCRASVAKKVLDVNPLVGLLLPCRMVVYETERGVVVAAMRPIVIRELSPDNEYPNVEEVDEDIRSIVTAIEDRLTVEE